MSSLLWLDVGNIPPSLCWLQPGHRLTPQDLQEVADLVSEDDQDCAYIVHMLTTL